jgi:nucleoside recognition membrane protein YjiH
VIAPYYGTQATIDTHRVAHILTSWQRILRFHGPLMLVSLLLVLSGLAFARGRMLRTMLLLAIIGFGIPVVSVLTVMWTWRYAVPLQPAIAGAGAIGAVATIRGLASASSWRFWRSSRTVTAR